MAVPAVHNMIEIICSSGFISSSFPPFLLPVDVLRCSLRPRHGGRTFSHSSQEQLFLSNARISCLFHHLSPQVLWLGFSWKLWVESEISQFRGQVLPSPRLKRAD